MKNKRYVDLQYQRYNELVNELRQYQVEIVTPEALDDALLEQLATEFKSNILPTLTPLALIFQLNFIELLSGR